MTDMTKATEEIQATVPVTITVDLQQLLAANVGEIPPYTGDDDDYEPPTPIIGAIIGAVAHVMARNLMNDATGYGGMKAMVREQIDEQIAATVASQLDREFKPVDQYGEVDRYAEPTTLREQIKAQASTALANGMKPSNSSYGRPGGELKKYIDTEVDRVIKAELLEEVKQAKAAVVDKVRANAAQVITDTIAKSVR